MVLFPFTQGKNHFYVVLATAGAAYTIPHLLLGFGWTPAKWSGDVGDPRVCFTVLKSCVTGLLVGRDLELLWGNSYREGRIRLGSLQENAGAGSTVSKAR